MYLGKNLQLERESVIQKKEQFFSNDIMCKMLSAAENYYNLSMNKNSHIFDYYSCEQSKENSKRHLLKEIEIFKHSYENFHDKYSNYDFPSNLNKNEIKEIVENWKNEFKNKNNQDYKYYESILSIIEGNYHNVSLRNDIKELNTGKINTPGNVSYQLMTSVPYVQEMANRYEHKIENDIMNGKYNSKVHLNKNYNDNHEMVNVRNKINNARNNNIYNYNFSKNNNIFG